MIPINVKKYKERQTELITKLEGMVQTCQTETRSFNEAEQGEYASIMQELRSIEIPSGPRASWKLLRRRSTSLPAARSSVLRRKWRPAHLSAISAALRPMWRPVRRST